MLKLYVFWGIFALVLIGVCVSVVRTRSARKKADAETAKSSATVAPGESPAATPAGAAFDPNATRIHFRTSPTRNPSALLNRDEEILSTTGSARLVCVAGTQKDHSFPVTVAGITVGRNPQSDIVISDPRASHHHAWVGIIEQKAVLRDLGSTNGTFLNAQIDVPVSEVVLSPGDTIFFGGHGRDQYRFVVD